jgi:hypothetical protein
MKSVYLRSRSDIDTSNLSILGHSQGGNIAPYASMLYNAKYTPHVKNVIMLNGVVNDYGPFAIDQFKRIKTRCAKVIDVCTKEKPDSPLIPACNNTITEIDAILPQIITFYKCIKESKIPINRVYCAPSCINGYYYYQQYNYTSIEFNEMLLLNSLDGVNVLSVNSPTDPNIPAPYYKAIIEILKIRSGSLRGRSEALVFDNLTHFDTPADYSSNRMTEQVLESLLKFINA